MQRWTLSFFDNMLLNTVGPQQGVKHEGATFYSDFINSFHITNM